MLTVTITVANKGDSESNSEGVSKSNRVTVRMSVRVVSAASKGCLLAVTSV